MGVLQAHQQNTGQVWSVLLERIAFHGFVFTMLFPIKINIPFLGLLFVCIVINKRFGHIWQALRSNTVFIAILLYYTTLVLSLLYSEDVITGVKNLETKLAMLFLPFLLSGIPEIEKEKRLIMINFILGVVAVSVYSIISTIIVYRIDFSDWSYFSWVLPETINLNSSQYSIYIVCALFFLITGQIEKGLLNIIAALILGFYLVGFLAFMSSRLALILFVLMTLTYFLVTLLKTKNRNKRIVLFLFSGVIILMTVCSILFIPYLNDRMLQLVNGLGQDPRSFIFRAGFEILKDNFYLGVGIGDIQNLLNEQYHRLSFQEGIHSNFNAHNDWLTSILGAGLPGIISLIFVYYSYFRSALSTKNILAFAFPVFFLLASQTEAILNRHKGVLLFMFLISVTCINPIFKKENNA